MAKMSLSDKTQRTLQFLHALGHPRIARALAGIGFKQADLDEGWTLLRTLREVRFDAAPPSVDPGVLARLDQWENRWFPVADAAIKRRHPAVHAALFLNLSQATGLDVIHTVSVLLERLDALAASSDPEAKAALEILRARGLDDARLGEARALLTTLTTLPPASTPPDVEDAEALAQREAALWAWYLEWSALARSVIGDRRLLRSMGFLRGKRAGASDDEREGEGGEGGDDGDDERAPPAPPA